MDDKPLLLHLIEKPYSILLKPYHLAASIIASPLYILLKYTQSFIFSEIFAKHYKVAAWLIIPRAVLLLIIFLIPVLISIGASIAFYIWMSSVTNKKYLICVLTCLCFSLLLIYIAKGVKRLNIKHDTTLFTWDRYAKAVIESTIGMISLIFGLTTLLLLINRRKLIKKLDQCTAMGLDYNTVLTVTFNQLCRTMLSYNEMLLYFISMLALWRKHKLHSIHKIKGQINRMKLLYYNLTGFGVDLAVTPLAMIVLVSGTRTMELVNKIRLTKGTKWHKHILHEAKELIIDMLLLFPLLVVIVTCINFPSMAYHIWKYGPTENRMRFIRNAILLHCKTTFTIAIPVVVLLILNAPISIAFLWRPYLLYQTLNIPLERDYMVKVRNVLHYYYMKSTRIICRDALILPSALLTLVFIWRIPIFKQAFSDKFHTSKLYLKWTIRHLVVLSSDGVYTLLLILHVPFMHRWKYAINAYQFDISKATIYSRFEQEKCIHFKGMLKSFAFCMLDVALLPVTTLLMMSIIRACAVYKLYSYPYKLTPKQ